MRLPSSHSHSHNSIPTTAHLLYLLLVVSLMIILHSSYADSNGSLVSKVCKKTSNYNFCIQSVYSDPRAVPDTDPYTLADIVFRLTYHNATTTRERIAALLRNPPDHGQHLDYDRLNRCRRDYDNGVAKLEEALNDLNSETFDGLASFARVASHGAADCEAAFQGAKSPLTAMNKDLKGLCEICVAVSQQFTGGL